MADRLTPEQRYILEQLAYRGHLSAGSIGTRRPTLSLRILEERGYVSYHPGPDRWSITKAGRVRAFRVR
jgi:hypothetical protein